MYNDFDKRMKEYENRNKLFLQNKTPVIIRLDGRAFHTFTKGLDKPFDITLNEIMSKTAEYLLNNISGCVFAYTQSDEISLLLIDYKNKDSQSWFDNNQQKLVSLSSSMATLKFNQLWANHLQEVERYQELKRQQEGVNTLKEDSSQELNYLYKRWEIVSNKLNTATFDSRAFNIPKDEILNYFIWRQKDCTKNSISMLAQAHFSHKQLQNKSGSDKQDMLMLQKNVNWNDVETRYKRGVAVYKKQTKHHLNDQEIINYNNKTNKCLFGAQVIRNKSFIDYEMPILTQDREFMTKLIEVKDETQN